MTAPSPSSKELRRVVIAAAVGNVIEWYDFYIFGSLAAILAVKFFEKSHPVAAFLSTVALFTIGFLIRPLGALVFGRIGDRVGRKYTFLLTLSGMGLSTALIGIVPSYAKIGIMAAIILFVLRLVQGLCLGGEYGGAITYVAEHVPDENRGYYTGWLQTSPTLGIVLSLAVILGTQRAVGTDAFNEWGWRVPFLLSFLMVAVAIYIRLRLQETPIFQALRAKGQTAANPWVTKMDLTTRSLIVGLGLLIATPTLILFGWLSDKIGRKPVILAGFFLAAVTYYPLYVALGFYARPEAVNYPMAILIVVILVSYVGMVYGPIGAFLAEYFPARIRYSSVSVPYHIGNGWGGGLVPFITSAVYLSTHSVGWALAYPIAVPAVAFALSLFLMPETRTRSIWAPEASL